jgi:hypothetical protein
MGTRLDRYLTELEEATNTTGAKFYGEQNSIPKQFSAATLFQSSKLLNINNQTDDYELVLTDEFGYIRMNKATALTLTVQDNAAVAFSIGTEIYINQVGAGQLTIAEAVGVTVNTPETLLFRKQGASGILRKVDTDEWDLDGYLQKADGFELVLD